MNINSAIFKKLFKGDKIYFKIVNVHYNWGCLYDYCSSETFILLNNKGNYCCAVCNREYLLSCEDDYYFNLIILDSILV